MPPKPCPVCIQLALALLLAVTQPAAFTANLLGLACDLPGLDHCSYLPAIENWNVKPFTGMLTDNGVPVAGETLTLLYTAGSSAYTVYATAATLADGSYSFPRTPLVDASRSFFVRWVPSAGGLARLSSFACNPVTPTTPDYTCDINIHDVSLVFPADGASVSSPVTYAWTKRPTTSDDYFFSIYDTGGTQLSKSGPLGYTSSRRIFMSDLVLQINTWYFWKINVVTPDGVGICQASPRILFNDLIYNPSNSRADRSRNPLQPNRVLVR